MKNFWGSFLGSILGASIAVVLFAILVIAGVAAVVSSEFGGSEQVQTEAEEKTVLHLTFSYPVVDSPDQNPLAEIDFGSGPLFVKIDSIIVELYHFCSVPKTSPERTITGLISWHPSRWFHFYAVVEW